VTCREFAEFIADFLSDELAPDTRATFESHLAICENCQKYLDIYGETIRLGRGAFADDAETVPSDVPAALVDAILAARRRSG